LNGKFIVVLAFKPTGSGISEAVDVHLGSSPSPSSLECISHYCTKISIW
jgi:hypothetical protein